MNGHFRAIIIVTVINRGVMITVPFPIHGGVRHSNIRHCKERDMIHY